VVITAQEVGRFSGALINQGTPGVPFKRGTAFCQVVTYKPLQTITDRHSPSWAKKNSHSKPSPKTKGRAGDLKSHLFTPRSTI